MYAKMKKSLGNKRVYLTDEQIAEIVKAYSGMVRDATFALEYKEPVRNNGGTSSAVEDEAAAGCFQGV